MYSGRGDNMKTVMEKISCMGIVPVVVIDDADTAVLVAEALLRGGIRCAEVTFRTAAAEESIRRIKTSCPDLLLGAGTVLSMEQVDKAVSAGAEFIVTPGYNPNVVNYCVERQIPVIPGCMDTNAIEMALEAGLDTVKFFPAEAAGGLNMLKALSGPYVNLKFMPTGGISQLNLREYLAFRKVVACGGSWMVKGDLIKKGRYDEIERLSREAIDGMLNLRIDYTRLPDEIRVVTDHVSRAVYYLEKQGIQFDMTSAKYAGSRLVSVSLEATVGNRSVILVESTGG